MIKIIIVVHVVLMIMITVGDRFNLRAGNFTWCYKWYQYAAQYSTNLFFGLFTQPLNAILFGDPDDSLSGRTGRSFITAKIHGDKPAIIFWGFLYYYIGALGWFAAYNFEHCKRRIGQ